MDSRCNFPYLARTQGHIGIRIGHRQRRKKHMRGPQWCTIYLIEYAEGAQQIHNTETIFATRFLGPWRGHDHHHGAHALPHQLRKRCPCRFHCCSCCFLVASRQPEPPRQPSPSSSYYYYYYIHYSLKFTNPDALISSSHGHILRSITADPDTPSRVLCSTYWHCHRLAPKTRSNPSTTILGVWNPNEARVAPLPRRPGTWMTHGFDGNRLQNSCRLLTYSDSYSFASLRTRTERKRRGQRRREERKSFGCHARARAVCGAFVIVLSLSRHFMHGPRAVTMNWWGPTRSDQRPSQDTSKIHGVWSRGSSSVVWSHV